MGQDERSTHRRTHHHGNLRGGFLSCNIELPWVASGPSNTSFTTQFSYNVLLAHDLTFSGLFLSPVRVSFPVRSVLRLLLGRGRLWWFARLRDVGDVRTIRLVRADQRVST